MSLPPWDPDDYDRAIRSERVAKARQRRIAADPTARSTRGLASDADLRRRKLADRAMRRNLNREGKNR